MAKGPKLPPKPSDLNAIERAEMDFNALIQNPTPAGVAPYQYLPSGHYLHNPAKKQVKSGTMMADKLVSNATNGANNWVQGMQNPSRNPAEAALDAADKWKNNLQKAITEDRFRKGVQKINQSEAIQTAVNVGADGFSAGIQARRAKISRKFNALQPFLQAASDAAQAMPNATDADRENRAVANIRNMRKIKGQV